MKRISSVISLSFIVLFLFVTPIIGFSVSDKKIKEDYDLQERCGNKCGEWFKKEYGNGYKKNESSEVTTKYTNHYNKKQNKCFILLNSYSTRENVPVIQKVDNMVFELYDINENKNYGTLRMGGNVNEKPVVCFVLNKSCSSFDEWNSLVKPYMEE